MSLWIILKREALLFATDVLYVKRRQKMSTIYFSIAASLNRFGISVLMFWVSNGACLKIEWNFCCPGIDWTLQNLPKMSAKSFLGW